MALRWSWAFGAETQAALTSAGFVFSAIYTATSTAGETYTYSGSPTRYSGKMSVNNSMNLPATVGAGVNKGWFAVPIRVAGFGLPAGNRDIVSVVTAGGTISARMVSTTGALGLYMNNVLKGTTAPFDWNDWHYVALRFDVSTATFSAVVAVDGTQAFPAVGVSTQAVSAQTDVSFRVEATQNNQIFGQFVVYDNIGTPGDDDVAPKPMYVTRVDPTNNPNLSSPPIVGTWTSYASGSPSGALHSAAVDSPLDSPVTTYVQNAAPASGDRLAVASSTLSSATALNVSPPNIYGITLHTYSAGQAVTARARVSDDGGTTWDSGSNTLIDGTATTYAYATSLDKPSSGGSNTAWAAGDTVTMAYEVV